MLGSSLPPVYCVVIMSYFRYLCLFVHSAVQHILCCIFVFVLSSSCVLYVTVTIKSEKYIALVMQVSNLESKRSGICHYVCEWYRIFFSVSTISLLDSGKNFWQCVIFYIFNFINSPRHCVGGLLLSILLKRVSHVLPTTRQQWNLKI
jgi:hypothetical protein